MNMRKRMGIVPGATAALALAAGLAVSPAMAADRPMVEPYLVEGQLAEGHAALEKHLAQHPGDAQAQFGLGVLELLQSVEGLAQGMYRHGALAEAPPMPFVRVPTLENKQPKPIDYEKFRGIIQQFVDELAQAESTLAKVDDDAVKLPLRVGLIRLDLDGDGTAGERETFWRVFAAFAGRTGQLDEKQRAYPITFDQADIHWMRGYTHLLRAMGEAYLAHDSREFFDHTAHVFFSGARSPYPELQPARSGRNFDAPTIADLVLAIHLFHWEPTEPERLQRAHTHLLAMIQQSRQCWQAIHRETDDDREWIPGPDQTSLTPLRVTPEIVAGWKEFLDESEAILEGKKLVPHWRVSDGRGLNLRRVFHEPRTLDLVKLSHGAAAIPYLEQGEMTSPQTWRRLQRTFGGNFLAFAVWFQ